ncbi:histidine phosphatase family protein [Rhodococcoides fascians A25f]|uniref:histidine phosphatase family protein n=1 Tax=Rhodococcoides fascians TaxID=1828 RepID=UPI00055E78F5|nr:histidine phosphatase family protein [Rhodococcus fascians]QII07721.1 histidine phosphatase family protein [Rhodococcus fascians A25f]
MTTRYVYLARHGDADAFGRLTDVGREQAGLLGERLGHIPLDVVWHSPLPRAVDTAHEIVRHRRSHTPVIESDELIDNVPYVPTPNETPPSWIPFFDGWDADDALSGADTADHMIRRFAATPDSAEPRNDTHELLVTHAYPIAWFIRHALDAPRVRWLGIDSANTALTVIEYRTGLPPSVVMFNDMSHLPRQLQWTGFPTSIRP